MGGIEKVGVAPPIQSKYLISYIYRFIAPRVLKISVSVLLDNVSSLTKNGRDWVSGRGTSHTKKIIWSTINPTILKLGMCSYMMWLRSYVKNGTDPTSRCGTAHTR